MISIASTGILLLAIAGCCDAFAPTLPATRKVKQLPSDMFPSTNGGPFKSSTLGVRDNTALFALLEVPPGTFTVTLPLLGIFLSISKNFNRLRMEERAWEQRLQEAREKRLREDPTLSEIDLIRKEASLEWSAYGKPRIDEERERRGQQSGRRVKVMERVDEDEDDSEYRQNRMTDDEITLFEAEYGVDYDPYYDDPYTEDELPDDMPFKIDGKYGDRIYSTGEVFYKDKATGMFYRQGAKPRSLSFWG